MRRFADLLDTLVYTPRRTAKITIIVDYCRHVPDPDRGYGIAALTRDLKIGGVKPAMIRTLIEERLDSELFRLSYDYVGDLAETVALAWPQSGDPDTARTRSDPPRLAAIVTDLQSTTRSDGPVKIRALLDRLDPSGRYALLKLITGALRVGVTARLAKQALADLGNRPIAEIEEIWHGLAPPYTALFAWLEGRGDRPAPDTPALFRPAMLANPIRQADFARLDPVDYAAEWKWDGIRVQ